MSYYGNLADTYLKDDIERNNAPVTEPLLTE